MSSAVIAENYSAAKLKEYICFVEQLGSNIHFHENKWVCSNLRRSPAERSCMFSLYFDRIPALHRETVKSFAAISLIRGKKISTVKSYVMDLIRFFDFWSLDKGTLPLSGCDELMILMVQGVRIHFLYPLIATNAGTMQSIFQNQLRFN